MYIIIKLSESTIPFIENVNNPRNPKYLVYLGSPFMYSVEYKWTKNETKETTTSIIAESSSNLKPCDTSKFPKSIHLKVEVEVCSDGFDNEENRLPNAMHKVTNIKDIESQCALRPIRFPIDN